MKKKQLFLITCFVLAFGFFLFPQGKVDADAAARARLNYSSIKMEQLKTRQIKVINRRGRRVVWTSSNPKVILVDNGRITTLKGGKATVTAKVGTQSHRCKVTVTGLNATQVVLAKGDKFQLSAKNGKNTTWKSNKEDIATVTKKGIVKAKKTGTTQIVCKTNGKKVKCRIYVAELNQTALRLTAENTYRLSVSYAGGETVRWSSSNPAIAQVDAYGNVISYQNSGKATIYAKVGKATLACAVTVVSPNNIYTDISTLPMTSNVSRQTVAINSYPNVRYYTVYNQSSSENASDFPSYMPQHGCAASALAATLTGFGRNIVPKQITDQGGLENTVFGTAVWGKNYGQSLAKQMPVSLYGITKILNYTGIRAQYVRQFEDGTAYSQITAHLKTGNPVIIEMKKGRWANSYHTMVLLGLTNTGRVIVADSANRSVFGSQQRIKYELLANIINEGMFSCTDSGAKSTNCYFTTAGGGGYILVNPDIN